VPIFAFFVVNGKLEIFAFKRVAALKKVVLPAFVFPISPIVNNQAAPQLNIHTKYYISFLLLTMN
jgi:hypothetical protein